MNKLVIALAAIAGFAAPAFAADMAVKAPAPVTVGWTGFYLGLNAGYGWGSADVHATPGDPYSQNVFNGQPNIPPLAASINPQGALGGIQAGYDWQFAPRWLVGFETDFDGAGLRNSASIPVTIGFGLQPATFGASQRTDWLGTSRARLGILPTPDLLLYATGGVAYGKVGDSTVLALPPGQSNSGGNFGFAFACGPFYGLSPNCFAGNNSRVATGWAAGVGGEQRIALNWSVKLEYLHVDLGRGSHTMIASITPGAPFLPAFLNANTSTVFDLVRAGVNYRF